MYGDRSDVRANLPNTPCVYWVRHATLAEYRLRLKGIRMILLKRQVRSYRYFGSSFLSLPLGTLILLCAWLK